jgi:quinoprotein glucose dehydrogenase
VIDFTPQLRAEALEMLSRYNVGGPFMPRLYEGHNTGVEDNIRCYGGLNITNPATLDPTTGILYVPSSRGCSGGSVMPGEEADEPDNPATTGTTISRWVAGPGGGLPRVQGLPAWKPPYNRVSAYDMNTGERIWWVPIGEVSDEIRNHPALQGQDMSRWGGGGNSIQMVAGDLLYTTEGSTGAPVLNAWNKLTGEHVGEIEMPGSGQYGMMTYMHDGQQTIVVQVGRPARLVALRLPG